ncbi:MAG: ATP-binding protein [Eubacterium sp.]|nr:ATP-binding protein [Eubacterium sp.]
MNKAINIRMMIVATIAILFTALLSTFCYYRVFQEEVLEDLEVYARILSDMDSVESEKYAEELSKSEIRMTIISENGEVIFDNVADVSGLENHRSRAEIKAAYSVGEGYSVRKSESLRYSNYYYAVRLPNGGVIRTAKKTSSIFNIFGHAFPYVILIVMVILIISYIISRLLTRSIVLPVEKMADSIMGEGDKFTGEKKIYSELVPVMEHIRSQHEDLLNKQNIRQEFTANVSHELKTPLTSISGYSELIENGMTDEETTRKFAGEIHAGADRMLVLINDILRLSEMDTSDESLTMEDVDIHKIALDCQAMLEPMAEKHSVTVHVSGEKCVVYANKSMMEELMYNLCDNAIRYNNPNGNVWIETSDQRLSVKDDGIGISKENQERVFERFFRVDKSRSRKTGGTGLGLAIVKHIVELSNAKLIVNSSEGQGTEMIVDFKS